MRLHVFSDTHFDFFEDPDSWWGLLDSFRKKYDDPDAVVLAGDICGLGPRQAGLAEEMMRGFADRYSKVVYVPGNHEFYGTTLDGGIATISGWKIPNLYLLQPGYTTAIAGRIFRGGTMWFEDPGDDCFKHGFSDFRNIIVPEPGIYEANTAFKTEVMGKCQPGDVVVSHHLPSPRSTPPRFKGSPLNNFFVTDVSDLIRSRRPALFIHGHTHSPFKYTIGDTTVFANPWGYPNEGTNSKFWARAIVTL